MLCKRGAPFVLAANDQIRAHRVQKVPVVSCMLTGNYFGLAAFVELSASIVARCIEQPIADLRVVHMRGYQRLGYKLIQCLSDLQFVESLVRRDRLRGMQRKGTDENRQASEYGPLDIGDQ